MTIKDFKKKEETLHQELWELREEQNTFVPKLEESFLERIASLLSEMLQVKDQIEFYEEFRLFSVLYRGWLYCLNNVGFATTDFPFSFPEPNHPLKSLRG